MKISWGHKIAFAYLAFVAGIAFLVFKASGEKYDLVTKDYYGEELKYQQIIDQSANTHRLSAPVAVEKTGTDITIRFPEEMKDRKKEIDFYLYCPADAKKDFRKLLEINEAAFTQPLPAGSAGLYELKLSWKADGIQYYYEQKIFL